MTKPHRTAALMVVLIVAVGSLVTSPPTARAGAPAPFRPMIFVHGFAGSAGQFEAQAMRFTSNGYPVDHIVAHEYDSSFGLESQAEVLARLDGVIDDLKARTGATQVDLLGHSLGTGLMQAYLESDPARAANVAHYVNLDGAQAAAPPGGVPTLAVWGAGDPTREIVGARNVYFPDQTHVEVVTSTETFAEIYRFFNDAEPQFTEVVEQHPGEVTIAGRALLFLTNEGAEGTMAIYDVDPATGYRLDETPEATFPLSGDGSWGPFDADPTQYYEFHLTRGDEGSQHLYYQPFVRTDHFVRLLTSEPNSGLDAIWDKSDDHSNLSIVRNKEWWGDQGALSDALEIDGTNVLNAATAPQSKRAVGVFVYDVGSDSVSDTSAPIPAFFALPFLTGIDLYVRGVTPPDDTVAIVATPRRGAGPEVINVPNYASDTDRITVVYRDFHVTIAPQDETQGPGETVPVSTPSQATAPSFTG
jgi:hypothetical protein